MLIANLLHVLATIVWVGGMFFAHQCLRPAVLAQLDQPPLRLKLWNAVFGRFFPWVWVSVLVLLGTGQWMVVQMGGMAGVAMQVHVMVAIGYLMAAIFAYIYFVPYARLRRAVATEDWPAGKAALDRIRVLVGTNLALGLVNVSLVFLMPLLG
jgi:uncharacterized membrane protein